MFDESGDEPIAVIGMEGRFPGAGNLDELWENILNGVDALREVPPDRFDIDQYYDPRPEQPGKIATRRGGFLEEIRRFDASLFGISAREASSMDPQHRILLEVVYHLFQDAAQPVDGLEDSETGVFIGMIANEYLDRVIDRGGPVDVYLASGANRAAASGRISHAFGLNGPSVTIDAACSSSLVTVDMACDALRSGRCELAIAGGANLVLAPESSVSFSSSGVLAADGRCKFGDASADGFVRSDGVGAVLLKPLVDAVADGDPIRGVIRESATNNDGRRGAGLFLTPSRAGQRSLLEDLYEERDDLRSRIRYVEAHGTGTRAGDPVEIGALQEVLGEPVERDEPLWVGSVKTNIGHTEATAGLAGLMKALLVLEHGVVPPSIHFETPNPEIEWDSIDVEIPTEPVELGGENPAAAVSAFGITGTNAHVVVEGAPERDQVDRRREDPRREVLPMSASTPEALRGLAERYRRVLGNEDVAVEDVCHTAARRRKHCSERMAVQGKERDELRERLEAVLETTEGESSANTAGAVSERRAFIFSGQGGQWLEMGRSLYEDTAEFADHFECVDAAFREVSGWSPRAELLGDDESWVEQTDSVQPLIFAVQVTLAESWRDRGVEPDVVAGHSLGEVAAAHVAGVLSLGDAIQVVCARSRLLTRIAGDGAMAVVGLSSDEVSEWIDGTDGVSVGVHSGPSSSVISGRAERVEEMRSEFEARDIFCRMVDVDVASHSPQVEPLLDELEASLSSIEPGEAEIPLHSTVRGEVLDGPECGPEYWRENLRRPVRLEEVVGSLIEQGIGALIEVGPHPVLSHALREIAESKGGDPVVIPSMTRETPPSEAITEGIVELYEAGLELDWETIAPRGRALRRPRYPLDGEEYWFDAEAGEMETSSVQRTSAAAFEAGDDSHPLLQRRFTLGSQEDTTVFEVNLDVDRFWYLDQHRIHGTVVFPGAAYVEMAMAAGRRLFDTEEVAVESVEFENVLTVADQRASRLQLVAESVAPDRYEVEFYSLRRSGEGSAAEPERHASATLAIGKARDERVGIEGSDDELSISGAAVSRTAEEFYDAMEAHGIESGPGYRCVHDLRYDEEVVRARHRVDDSVQPELHRYHYHPTMLDGIFQLVGPYLLEDDEVGTDTVFLPAGIDSVRLHASPKSQMRAVARRLERSGDGDTVTVDIRTFDEEGEPVADVVGLTVRRVERAEPRTHDLDRESLYEWNWRLDWTHGEQPTPYPEDPEPAHWVVVGRDQSEATRRLVEAAERDFDLCTSMFVGGCGAFDPPEPSREAFAERVEAIRDGRPPITGLLWIAPDAGSGTSIAGPARALESTEEASVLIQALSDVDFEHPPELVVATRGVFDPEMGTSSASLRHAPLWGLTRVARNEHPAFSPRAVDLPSVVGTRDADMAVSELRTEDAETEVVLRQGDRYVHRLRRSEPNDAGEKRRSLTTRIEGDSAFRLERTGKGVGGLTYAPISEASLERGEVEIDIEYSALNFADVVAALGLMEEAPDRIGYECSGRVRRVGDAVDDLEVGDPVMAFAPTAHCFGGFGVMERDLVCDVPEELSLRRAATIPTVYMTAYYALIEEGRLREEDRVLIHSASGGVGHAALWIARATGAEIFATAGTPKKRRYLREEFDLEHVMDSRSLDFADEIERITGGGGVDVVLNTLTGEGTRRGFEVLNPLGRFLDLSKSEMYEEAKIDLDPFGKNLSYAGIDITEVAEHRPELVAEMWREIRGHLKEGAYRPIPIDRVFDAERICDAFDYMRRGEHIGKIVVDQDFEAMEVERPATPETLFRSDGCYLLTGGTGGLGLETAEYLSERGAGCVVLLSRSGADDAAAERIRAMRRAGTEVEVVRGDVADAERMSEVVGELRSRDRMLRGVFHLAGVLDDGLLVDQTREKFESVFRPKVRGAWNLHRETADLDLDHFVLFSSAATVIGSPGQSNYAAASEWLDAFAAYRRSLGHPAISIGWGDWTEVGLAAERESRGARLDDRGLKGIGPAAGIALLERVLVRDVPPRVGAFRMEWSDWADSYPQLRESAPFSHLIPDTSEERGERVDRAITDRLDASAPAERSDLVEEYLREEVSDVLGRASTKIDFSQPVARVGLDSLMVVELRVRLENHLGVEISSDTILGSSDLRQLTGTIVDELELD